MVSNTESDNWEEADEGTAFYAPQVPESFGFMMWKTMAISARILQCLYVQIFKRHLPVHNIEWIKIKQHYIRFLEKALDQFEPN